MTISRHRSPSTPAPVAKAISYKPASNVVPGMKPINASASTSGKGK